MTHLVVSESGDVWKISWNLNIVATRKNHYYVILAVLKIFVGGIHTCSHDFEISADFSDVSWFTAKDYWQLDGGIHLKYNIYLRNVDVCCCYWTNKQKIMGKFLKWCFFPSHCILLSCFPHFPLSMTHKLIWTYLFVLLATKEWKTH